MKTKVLGVRRITGEGAKGAYDFAVLWHLHVIQSGGKVQAFGYEPQEVPMEIALMRQFRDVQFPVDVDLEVELQSFRGAAKPIVIGVTFNGREPGKEG